MNENKPPYTLYGNTLKPWSSIVKDADGNPLPNVHSCEIRADSQNIEVTINIAAVIEIGVTAESIKYLMFKSDGTSEVIEDPVRMQKELGLLRRLLHSTRQLANNTEYNYIQGYGLISINDLYAIIKQMQSYDTTMENWQSSATTESETGETSVQTIPETDQADGGPLPQNPRI